MTESDSKADGRVSRAQKQRAFRRSAVLHAARTIFANKGYAAASIDDIIDAAGIARGTFYLYFQSKRAIFEELLDSFFLTLSGQVRRIETDPGAPPPYEQMFSIISAVLRTLYDNREIARILLREAISIDADFDRKLADFYGRIIDLMVRAVESGKEMGLVRPCDSETVARCALGATKELVHHHFVVEPSPARSEGPDNDKIALMSRELIAFVLQGVFVR